MAFRLPAFDPRPYQLEVLSALDKGFRRAVLVWHRRAGKEVVCFNYLVRQAFWHRVGTYVYFFPTTRLGRRILWDGINRDGSRFLSYIPKEIVDKVNEQEMKVKLVNGSVIQIIGTDLIENVGINPVGVVFSEFSLQDPKAWSFTRPILRENKGWAIFNFTPRGRNHAYELYLMAKNNPRWFCQRLTVDDTSVLTAADIEAERREGVSEQMIQQEYYCDFDQGAEGAYYAKLLNQAEIEGRLCVLPFDPQYRVSTFWDIGVGDETAILFVQLVGQEVYIINQYNAEGEGLAHYAGVLDRFNKDFGYLYDEHYAPHDIQVRELGSGAQTRLQIARELGIHFKVVPNIGISEGIELARGIFPRLRVDAERCNYFIKCAENYHKKYNERLNVYSDKPEHDWSSHCFTGDTLVWTRNGMQPIMSLPQTGEVLTLNGWRKYSCPRITRRSAPIVEVTFQDGIRVKCTPDHLFLTENGWMCSGKLEKGSKILSCSMRESSILNQSCTNFFRMNRMCSVGGSDFIEKFGGLLMELSQKIAIYITRTQTLLTTRWKTLSAWIEGNTLLQRQKRALAMLGLQGKDKEKQRSGTDQRRVNYGIVTTPKEQRGGLNGSVSRETALNVARSLIVSSERMDTSKNTVTPTVRLRTIEKVERIKEAQDVWCITVPGEEHFCLENGAVVHNCMDAFRYMSVVLNKKRRGTMSEEEAEAMQRAYMLRY